jgi:pyridoxal phosphate enzyme (YggS family)
LPSADIKANLQDVKKRIVAACLRAGRSPSEVTLIGVTKTVEPTMIETAFKLGVCHFGENRVQEAAPKIGGLGHLSPRPTWHMIGHLQSNKVKSAMEVFDVIQSVDSVELAEALDLKSQGRINGTPVLLQVNVSGEATKSGFSLKALDIGFFKIGCLHQIEIRGLMTIAPASDDPEQVRPVFRKLRELRDFYHLQHLSMGMTGDFEVAIEEGATMVRLGRAIFGERDR